MSRSQCLSNVVPSIQQNEIYKFFKETTGIRLVVEWISIAGVICDLDVFVLFYDEKARFIEKLTADKTVSRDGSTKLVADTDCTSRTSTHQENLTIDLSSVDVNISAILVFLDGGERNFQLVQRINIHCSQENVDSGDSLSNVAQGAFLSQPLFMCSSRTRSDSEGVVLSVLYKDGWNEDGTASWNIRNLYDSVFTVTSREKNSFCANITAVTVPAFERYRPRLFPSVKAICTVLSSKSLPKLKEHFQHCGARTGGLNMKEFTDTIFRQLYITHPKVIEEEECAHTVAVIQEMFCQMNFNKDAVVDWDEFTSFCIQTDVSSANACTGKLDDYVVAYTQDHSRICSGLTSYSPLVAMKYLPSEKRIMVIPDRSDKVIMFNDKFELTDILDPVKVPDTADPKEKIKIHDVIYIASKDIYTYCASDHTIVACREQSSINNQRSHYTTVHKIFSSFLHLKLCWSECKNTLCSVGADNTIFGWDIESGDQIPIFHISRHKDIITDFIAIDVLDLYITCSLDKKIVLWSQTSRRVKGILMGHKRGVRCLSYAKGVLLSAGFDCEARTWDMSTKEPSLILRGHRKPVVAAKIMSLPWGNDLRAMTVDDDGEFRLWNILIRERSQSTCLAEVLQVFALHISDAGSHQVAKVRFLELPYDPECTQGGTYSNVIAGSPSLIHVTPEKNIAEFLPPACLCCSEASAVIMTGVGQSLLKYDISTGEFISSFPDMESSDISCFRLDDYYGRRVYVGCSSGRLLLLNFTTGVVLDSMMISSRAITCVENMTESSCNLVYIGSSDGRITSLEETSGKLAVRGCAEQLIGDNCGIEHICAVESLKVVVAASGGKYWGVWEATTFRRVLIMAEESIISGLDILGTSCDEEKVRGFPLQNNHLLTLAVCTGTVFRIYSMDTFHAKITVTHCLQQIHPRCITTTKILHYPKKGSLNYSASRSKYPDAERSYGDVMVAATEEGCLVTWSVSSLRSESVQRFSNYFTISRLGSRPVSRTLSPQYKDETPVSTDAPINDESVGSHSLGCKISEGCSTDDNKGLSVSAHIGFNTEVKSSIVLNRREQRELRMQIQSSKSQFRIVTNNSDLRGEDRINFVMPSSDFVAHNDTISAIVPLHDNGCVITVSLDGYHRIWNLDACCLGELPLPNIPDRLMNTKLFKDNPDACRWKFISESIPVLPSHTEFSEKLVASILKARENHNIGGVDMMIKYQESRGAVVSAIDDRRTADRVKLDSPMAQTPKSKSRIDSLKELCSQSSGKEEFDVVESSDRNDSDSVNSSAVSSKVSDIQLPATIRPSEKRASTAPSRIMQNQPHPGGRKRPSTASPTQKKLSLVGSSGESERLPSTVSESSLLDFTMRPSTPHIEPVKLLGGTDSCSVSSKTVASYKSGYSQTPSRKKSSETAWSHTNDLVTTPKAFSEHSISHGQHEGMIDTEGHHILRKVHCNKERLNVYRRSVPQMYLRNPKLSTQVEMPSLGSVEPTEVVFGTQKNMYKNANKNILQSKKINQFVAQHTVSVSRINRNLRSIGSMVHVDVPPICDVSEFPPEEDEVQTSTTHSTNMMTDSSALIISPDESNMIVHGELTLKHKSVDVDRVNKLMTKMTEATTAAVPEWELQLIKKRTKSKRSKTLKRVASSADANVVKLEKKLAASIRSSYSHSMRKDNSSKKMLNNRLLLPFYKVSDVHHFLHIFQNVDKDYSGDLDPEEWCDFFVALDKTVSRKEARTIFNRVDTHGNGCLSVKDLVPVVFSNAGRSLQGLILKYVELELSKRKIYGKNFLKESDVEVLFEYYDVHGVGYISVSLFREKVHSLQIPEAARYAILVHVKNIDNDEMLNAQEFMRIFRPYCV